MARLHGIGLLTVQVAFATHLLASSAEAQTATDAPPQSAEPAGELPPLVVETKQVPRKKAAPKAATVAAPAPTASQAPTTDEEPIADRETATGRVDGIVARQTGTGTKTDTPLIEVPQTVNVVTADEITQRGVQSVDEAFRYTPGVYTQIEGGGEGRRDTVFSRGFTVSQFQDGLPVAGGSFGYGVTQIEPYGIERFELMKGPTSGLFGQNSPGGILNAVSKRPTEETLRSVEFQTGSFDRGQMAFDFSGKATADGTVLYRLVGLGRDADTDYGRDDDRLFIAPSVTFKLDSATNLTLLAHYQKDLTTSFVMAPLYGSYYPNPLGPVNANRFWGEPDFDRYKREQWAVGYEFEHRFNPQVQFKHSFRYGETEDDMHSTQILDLVGFQELERLGTIYKSSSDVVATDNHVIIDADTGPFRHKLLLGFDYSREELADTGKSSPALDPPSWGGTFPTLDIFDPQFGLVDTSDFGPWLEEWKQVQHQTGLYIQDQIKLGGWVATLGLRQDWTRSTSRQDEVTKSEAEALTGRAGLTYLFDNGIAPFIGYATSFDPVSGYAFGNVPFDPTTGEQYEAGIKYAPRWFDGFFQVTVFDLTQQNILTPDPDPTHICGGFPCSIQTGEAQVRGFEFEAKTSPVPGLDVIVSYSYLDSEITKSNIDGEEGQPLHATPKHIASLWLFYTFQDGELVPGFGFGGGVRYRGDYYSNLAAGYPIDDVTLFDAALSYDFSKLDPKLAGLNLALNVNNVLDEEYLVSAQNWGALYGEGRSALVTMGYKW